MAIRVWNKPQTGLGAERSTYADYPAAATFAVGTAFELDIRAIDGKLLVSYPPGNWHHVTVEPDKPDA